MKKTFIFAALLISMASLTSGQFTKVGGGLTYGTGFHFNNVNSPQNEADLHKGPFAGIYVKGIYELNLPFHIAPSFAYFLPRENKSTGIIGGEGTRVYEMMFDLNGHYVINSLNKFELYGLAGLDITFTRLKWLGTTSSGSDNALGLNIGGGACLKITEKSDLSAEVKYIISKYDQLMINVGILVSADWQRKEENKAKKLSVSSD
jgi:opacity protein-like surface antigen